MVISPPVLSHAHIRYGSVPVVYNLLHLTVVKHFLELTVGIATSAVKGDPAVSVTVRQGIAAGITAVHITVIRRLCLRAPYAVDRQISPHGVQLLLQIGGF